MADRRRLLLTGMGALAAAAGGGLAWQLQRKSSSTRQAPSANDPATHKALQSLWSAEFATPAGPRLVASTLQGKPLLLNFWATWCPPCIEEFPLLNNFYRQNAANGWQVLGLAIDKIDAVQSFLQKFPVQFSIGIADSQGMDLMRVLGNSNGGLPFSLAIDAAGSLVQRKLGKLSPDDLAQWAKTS